MSARPELSPTGLPPAFPARAAWGSVKSLRAWQSAALQSYFDSDPRDFLAVATPGAGKTSFALTLAANLFSRRQIDRVIDRRPDRAPEDSVGRGRRQDQPGHRPQFRREARETSRAFVGVALTYAGVAANPLALRIRTEAFKTLVILDEIHHAGDALSWGEAVREAFAPAARRLMLTGTPFRSDANPIPFVPLRAGRQRRSPLSKPTTATATVEALADAIVRPVLFMAYSGDLHWRTSAGDEVAARLGEPTDQGPGEPGSAHRARPAGRLDSGRAARRRHPADRDPRQHAGRGRPGDRLGSDQRPRVRGVLRAITGRKPVLVLSDEAQASRKISAFTDSDDRWMVAVRMVSEGVDVPRLAVGVYATSTATPLFFAQAVGRFVRARRRGETASVFVPSVPNLLLYASELERERDHALRPPGDPEEADLLAAAERIESEPDQPVGQFAALASEADFDRVVFDGGEFGLTAQSGSSEEQDYLGLPGLLEPDQVKDLLRRHQARHQAGHSGTAQVSAHAELRALRKELNGARRGLAPPHRSAARRHSCRTALGLRRPAVGDRHGRRATATDRPHPALGGQRPTPVSPCQRSSRMVTNIEMANRASAPTPSIA